ncbi:ORF6C domain-containing protein [Clostridium beijerinckii]|uniref:ORF6C domain-containing protein n=1 Tax=Clostridium beijerinckii TaxID=1520 RepID=UPI00156EB8A0
MKDLKTQIENNTAELKETKDKLKTLIDNSTINSRQASKLLIHAKDRVNCLLGGASSKEYKKNSRTYFKNLWLAVCERFEVTSYKDLNPLNFNDAVTFVSGWSYR